MNRRGFLVGAAVAVLSGCSTRGRNEPSTGTGTLSPAAESSPTTGSGPTVERSLDASQGRCADGDADAAAVTVEAGTVSVDGTLSTPTPCHGVELAAADYDPSADALGVTVAPTDPASRGGCVQCVGAVDYEARLRLAGTVPDTVRVVHRAVGGSKTVTSASP